MADDLLNHRAHLIHFNRIDNKILRLVAIFLSRLAQCAEKACGVVCVCLASLDRPALRRGIEAVHPLRLKALEPAKGNVLPAADADLTEACVRTERQPLCAVDRASRDAGAVEVAGVAGIDGDRLKTLFQRRDLAHAVRRDAGIVLTVHTAVYVSLRLGMADEIDFSHVRSP